MEESKKRNILLFVAIATILLLVVGATYAYFQAQIGIGVNSNVNVLTGTTTNLSFWFDGDISITANQQNFGVNSGNRDQTINAYVKLMSGNTENDIITKKYYIYLVIDKNEIKYSTSEKKVELLLNIYNTNKSEYKIENKIIDYKTNIVDGNKNTLSGYDITNVSGIIPLIEDEISASAAEEITKNWEIKVTLINLDSDQNLNVGKEVKGKILILPEQIKYNLSDYIKELHNGEDGTNNIYFHDMEGNYSNSNLEIGDKSYRYSGSNEDVHNYVCFGSDEQECPEENLYRIIGVFNDEVKLIKADYANKEIIGAGVTEPSEEIDPDKNGSYYSGWNYGPNSLSNEIKDSFAHRYRGSLDHIDVFYWQKIGRTNPDWPTSLLNKIHLNTNFLNHIGNENLNLWQELIAFHDWYYKGSSWENIVIASKDSPNTIKTSYEYEITNQEETTNSKIGLMYMSDYLYAASPNNWDKKPFNGDHTYMESGIDAEGIVYGYYAGDDGSDYRSALKEDWLYLGATEWTITQMIDGLSAFTIHIAGDGSGHGVGQNAQAVRPCFYLISSAKISMGLGTKDHPFKVVLN